MSQEASHQSSVMDFSSLFRPNLPMVPENVVESLPAFYSDESNFQSVCLQEANDKLKDLMLEFAKVNNDKSAAETEAERCRNCLSNVRLELNASNGRYDAMMEEHRLQSQHWLLEKRELEARCMKLQSLETQHQASLRKKEQEYGRLQQLLQTAEVKQQPTTKRIQMNAPLTSVQFIPIASTASATMHDIIIQSSIARTVELNAELESVRSRLATSLAGKNNKSVIKTGDDKPCKRPRLDDDDDDCDDEEEEVMKQHRVRMPASSQRHQQDDSSAVVLRTKIDRLSSKLSSAYQVIKDQEDVISIAIHSDIQLDDNSDDASDHDVILQERELLNEVANNLRYERDAIQDIIRNASNGINPVLTPCQFKYTNNKGTPRTRSMKKMFSYDEKMIGDQGDACEDSLNCEDNKLSRNIFD